MHSTLRGIAAGLSDEDLLQQVRLLAGRERNVTVELVAHLAELDTRKLYLAQGYSSLFVYCTEVLRLAEHAAYNRIEAARASLRFPVVLDRLADGSLNLSTLRLLAPHLTQENHLRVLAAASRKSKRDVEVLIAHLCPRPGVPASVRKLPPPWRPSSAPSAASPACVPPAERGGEAPSLPGAAASPEVPNSGPPVAPAAIPPNRPVIVPLAPERYRVQFTVGREAHENLRRAQDLLRREIPDGDPGAIFERALRLLLEDIARKKLAATSKPWPSPTGKPRPGPLSKSRPSPPSKPRPSAVAVARSRHIPAHVKRAVWLRDGGQCAFVGKSGRRCRERAFLEFHHVDPYALGGEMTAANLLLHCRAHNGYEAQAWFGSFVPVGQEAAGPRARDVARRGG